MADIYDAQTRSAIMRLVHSKNTGPEIRVRSVLHSMGLRFRANRKELPGSPDIVLPRHGTVVLVNGCFWHRHAGCKGSHLPKSNTEYWQKKIDRNVARDTNNQRLLGSLGWRVLVLWECQISNKKNLRTLLEAYFAASPRTLRIANKQQLTLLEEPQETFLGDIIAPRSV